MPFKLALLVLSCCFSVWCQQKPCQMYFTLQPPLDIPCNPYTFKNTRVSLQCMVSAPSLNAHFQELNFTVEWIKSSPGALEKIIHTSDPDDVGLQVVTERSSHMYGESNLFTSVSVKSTLSVDVNQATDVDLPWRYWCRVLEKDLENYSYTPVGDSAITELMSKSHYLNDRSFYPPCVGTTLLHNAELKCVKDRQSPQSSPPHSTINSERSCEPNADAIVVSRGGLAALAVVGGFLIVLLLIMSFMVVYSCININGKKGHAIKSTGLQRNVVSFRSSVQSTETQEEEVGAITHMPYPLRQSTRQHPLCIRSSFGKSNCSSLHNHGMGYNSHHRKHDSRISI